jgi:hypothetical protein
VFANVQAALRHIHGELAQVLDGEQIQSVCREVGRRFRERLLDPVATIHLFVLQVLHGNCAVARLKDFTNRVFSDAAYCKARRRLPLAVLRGLLERVGRALQPTLGDHGRWRGHRTFHVDGSSFSMPDKPALQSAFGQPGAQQPGCGFAVAHMLALFHAGSGFLIQVLAAPLRTHDLSQTGRLHPELRPGDLLVGDRAFGSFAHFALLVGRHLHALFRAHQRQVISFVENRPHHEPGKRRLKGLLIGAILCGPGLLLIVLPTVLTIRVDGESGLLILTHRSLLTKRGRRLPWCASRPSACAKQPVSRLGACPYLGHPQRSSEVTLGCRERRGRRHGFCLPPGDSSRGRPT